jgi:hypothetical protein
MSHLDVNTVNERLNGLVALLQGVGVGGDQKQARQGGGEARPLDDDQIAAIIQTLKMAEAPQIIAALEAKKSNHTPPYQQHVEEENDSEDDEEDDDANYPMVGPGCSDDISVVSDLTTPTVVQGAHVPDEEHYRDTLPPLLIVGGGGPMLLAPTKRKNLVGSVRHSNTLTPRNPNATKPPNHLITKPSSSGGGAGLSKGAAAQRRKAYNATMERLAQDPSETGSVRSRNSGDRPSSSKRLVSGPPSAAKPQMSSGPPPNHPAHFTNGAAHRLAPPLSPHKVVKKAPRRASMAPPPTSHEWPEWSTPQNVDENGFLMTDPFAVAPPQRPAPRKAPSGSDPKLSSSGGDLVQRRMKKPAAPIMEAAPRQHFVEQPSSQVRRPPPAMLMGEPPKPAARRSRRASLAM